MAAYFDHPAADEIHSEEIYYLFRRANKRPNDFIRIEMTDEKMHLSKPNAFDTIEFEILEASLIFRHTDGSMERHDFEYPSNDKCFMAVIYPKLFMVYLLKTPDKSIEGEMLFDKNETFLGMFRTSTSTIFISYDGELEYFRYSYCLESKGYPSMFRLIRNAMDTEWKQLPASES